MDVILRNDPHVMDFNEYWNDEIYIEGVVGDKVKSVINKIIEFIKSIIKRIRGRFAYAKIERLKAAVADPNTAEKLKQQETSAWNTDLNIQFYQAGLDLVNTALNSFGSMFEIHSTRDVDNYIHAIETKTANLKKIVEQTRNNTDPNKKWSMYDAYNAIIEESLWQSTFTFKMESFHHLLKAHKKGDLESFYEQSGVDKDKIVEFLTVAYEGLLVYGKGMTDGNMLFGNTAEYGGYYKGKKASENISKGIKKALREQGEEPNKFGVYRVKQTAESVYDTIKEGDIMNTYDELDELNAYIEATVNDLHEAMELRNELIQESDDDTVEDFEESDDNFTDDYEEAEGSIWPDPKPGVNRSKQINDFDKKYHVSNSTRHRLNKMNDEEKYDNVNSGDAKKSLENRMSHIKGTNSEKGKKYKFEYYSDAIIRNYDDEPIEEETTYRLRSNDMFTESYDDEPYGPSRFYQEAFPAKYVDSALDAGLNLRITTRVFIILGAINTICTSLIYEKRLGRFPSEMKRVMDIIKKSKDGTVNTENLYSALGDLKHATKVIVGQHALSFKAKKNFTQTEREELKKMIRIIADLENMLTSKKYQAAERRVAARIEDFVTQADKVMKLINRGRNEGDVVKEYMS